MAPVSIPPVAVSPLPSPVTSATPTSENGVETDRARGDVDELGPTSVNLRRRRESHGHELAC